MARQPAALGAVVALLSLIVLDETLGGCASTRTDDRQGMKAEDAVRQNGAPK
jgi:hypothetical protein